MALYSEMKKRMARITITKDEEEEEGKKKKEVYRAGIILQVDKNYAYVIADSRGLATYIGTDLISISFPDEQILNLEHDDFHIKDGLVGIMCSVETAFNTDLVKTMTICHKPLEISQQVFVYEGFFANLVDGMVTGFDGDHFTHDCAVAYLSEFGAPVVTLDAKLVGMCDSAEYHLRAMKSLALQGAISKLIRAHAEVLK